MLEQLNGSDLYLVPGCITVAGNLIERAAALLQLGCCTTIRQRLRLEALSPVLKDALFIGEHQFWLFPIICIAMRLGLVITGM